METSEKETYRFKDIPLTSAILEPLILEIYNGKLVERQTMIDEVLHTHIARGGKEPLSQDLSATVKKTLSNLQKKGLAANPTYGYWRIGSENSVSSTNEPTLTPSIDLTNNNLTILDNNDINPKNIADLVIGEGNGAVYLYYLPLYRLKAEEDGELFWLCKIGQTERDPMVRILSQAGTALPEKPHVALIIKTKYPIDLESAIHSILTLRGRRIDTSPGTEWFLTSPDEVKSLYEFFGVID